MESQVELEICANCKREIPHRNYVMHTAHCARNISLCSTCKEPIPKADIEKHRKSCIAPPKPKPKQPPTKIEQSSYFKSRKEVEDRKVADRQTRRLERLERLVESNSNSVGYGAVAKPINTPSETIPSNNTHVLPVHNYGIPIGSSKACLLPCQFCELELNKLDLGEHESYCGARTEKCEDCGDMVMFKDKNAHKDSNHGVHNSMVKPASSPRENRHRFQIPPHLDIASVIHTERLESSRDISRRLDCKTEYIRNLLHDSASITAPLRSTGAIPRKKAAPNSPRRRNPPTEIVIPCEFCNTPIPHEDLIEHETGCRPDLARYNPRRRDSSPEAYPSQEPTSPDVEIPCEYCSDLIPASQFLNHQATCSCN